MYVDRKMGTINSFTDLNCWQASRKGVKEVSALIKTLPDHEKYDLSSNLIRAARSSTRNIAEGFGRHHHRENLQFCRISRGSLTELIDDFITCLDEQYINEEKFQYLNQITEEAIRILNGYIRYLKTKLDS